jgi:hypothetical protein|tara:strand:+ start:3600 stop:3881 length:282 start_codon:yes stop_codon:yes gene_type:complete
MLIWIFTILDLFVLTAISLVHFSMISGATNLLLFSISYLVVKAVVFRDIMSYIDLGVAFYILLMIFGIKISFIFYLAMAWFIYKLFFTIMGNM